MVHHQPRALEVHVQDQVEVLLGHRHQHAVAQDSGVVHDPVQVAEFVDRLLDHALDPFAVGDRIAVRDGLAAGGHDLVDDLLRRSDLTAAAVLGASEIVDDDRSTFGRHRQRVAPAHPAPCSGHDHHASIEMSHPRPLRSCVASDGSAIP